MVAEENIISKIKFAELVGVSRPAITKACKANRLGMVGKKINLEHRKTKEYIRSQKARMSVAPSRKKPPKKKPIPEKITAPTDDTPEPEVNPDIDLDKLDYENGYTLPEGINCFEDITIHNLHKIPADLVKKVKELEVAKKAKQDRDVKRGKLIEREVVFKFISQLYVIDVNQVKTQEDRLVPGLCGVFGVEDGSPESIEARKLIKNDSADLLESIQREVDDYLAGMVKVK